MLFVVHMFLGYGIVHGAERTYDFMISLASKAVLG